MSARLQRKLTEHLPWRRSRRYDMTTPELARALHAAAWGGPPLDGMRGTDAAHAWDRDDGDDELRELWIAYAERVVREFP